MPTSALHSNFSKSKKNYGKEVHPLPVEFWGGDGGDFTPSSGSREAEASKAGWKRGANANKDVPLTPGFGKLKPEAKSG